MTPHAQKKGLSLTAVIGQDVGTIVSDRRRVEQILLNLLSNGVKFTERGEVCLECHVRETVPRDQRPGHRDWRTSPRTCTGCSNRSSSSRPASAVGIRAPASVCRSARTCTRLLGGGIRAESTWGAGSTFTSYVAVGRVPGEGRVQGPVRIESRVLPSARCDGPGHGWRVNLTWRESLIIEDNETNLYLTTFLLSKAGHETCRHETASARSSLPMPFARS